jgi:hypothetical protein
MYMQRKISGAADNCLHTTVMYMRDAAGIGLGTTIKYLRRTRSTVAIKKRTKKRDLWPGPTKQKTHF